MLALLLAAFSPSAVFKAPDAAAGLRRSNRESFSDAHHSPAMRDEESLLLTPADLSTEVPAAILPDEHGQFHRFIREFVFSGVSDSTYKTPERFKGSRTDGACTGTRRVHFSLPGKEDQPKTIELLPCRAEDNPSFGAVQVKLPFDVQLLSKSSYLEVGGVKAEGNADASGIMEGDIIRAISLPSCKDKEQQLSSEPLQGAEEGMVILDAKSIGDYDAVLQEHHRLGGNQAAVVLLIERPSKIDFDLRTVQRFIRPYMRQVELEARNAKLGPEHPDTLDSKSKLAKALQYRANLQSLTNAAKLQKEILEVRSRTLGHDHPSTLTSKAVWIRTLQELSDLQRAEQRGG